MPSCVVGSATGGIPEVVADGETGLLIHFGQLRRDRTPTDPDKFVHDMAVAIDDMFMIWTVPGKWAG